MNEEEILNLLKHGTNDEIGKAILTLSRLKDPNYKELLAKIMNSGDIHLSVMAAYALGEAGEKSGLEFLQNMFHNATDIFVSAKNPINIKILEDILKLPDNVNRAFNLYNSSYFIESKNSLQKLLEIYSLEPPKTNISYYDDFISFSVNKTKGLLLDALAICEFNLGNVGKAFEHGLNALNIAQNVNDPQLLKIVYADLGHIHMSLGNYYSALNLLHQSLEIDESTHDPWRKKNRTLSNLSQLYLLVGQYEKAIEYIQNALELSEQENDIYGKARCLNTKGVILCSTGEFTDAETWFKEALSLSKNELNDKQLQVLVLSNLSFIYYSLGNIQKSEEFLKEAHDLSIQTSNKLAEANILTSMATIEIEKGNIGNAVEYAQSALAISLGIYDREGQVEANFVLGSIEGYYNGNFEKAYGHYQEAIYLSESLRKNLILDDFKMSFAGNYVGLYQQMILLCMKMGKTADAFEYIERTKSRALVDMLSSATDTINSEIISVDDLQNIKAMKGRLDLLRNKLASLHSSLSNSAEDKRKEDIYESTKEELREIENKYKKAFEDIKLKDPNWASLVSVDIVPLSEFQEILDHDTLCLNFYYSETEVIVIVVQKNKSPVLIRIPFDEKLDLDKLESLLNALANNSNTDIRSHEYIRDVKQPLSYFYELLIQPLSDVLKGIKHIIIIPHYFLHYLPFHALYDGVNKEYLIDKFSISYAPSATALYFSCKKNRRQYENALILANPSNDLPYAEEEAEKIKAIFKERGYLFTKDQASFDNLRSFQQADIIHLACHGYFREDEPIFSFIILSGPDAKGLPFFLPDFFNLKLQTSLVTLSACESGLSQFTTGDELIGMSRAFFYAGASTLLTSLWKVNDKSTAVLMGKFYNELVHNKASKSESLKNAMQELKAVPEYKHPYFWAPFFLSGDWR